MTWWGSFSFRFGPFQSQVVPAVQPLLPAHILEWATIFEFTSCSEAITYVIHSVYHYNDWELKSKEIDSSFHKFSVCAKRVRGIVPTCTTLSISWKAVKDQAFQFFQSKIQFFSLRSWLYCKCFNKSGRRHCFSKAQKEKNGILTLVLSHIVSSPAEFVMNKNSKTFNHNHINSQKHTIYLYLSIYLLSTYFGISTLLSEKIEVSSDTSIIKNIKAWPVSQQIFISNPLGSQDCREKYQ